jgi:SAM-dependent methyltransferase
MSAEYRSLIRQRILAAPDFQSAVFSGQRPGTIFPWIKVTIRPVLIRDVRMLQFECFDSVKGITANAEGDAAAARLDEILALPFKSCYVRGTATGIQIQITRKSKVLIREHTLSGPSAPDLSHDRRKKRPLDPAARGAFLQAVGIATAEGVIKPTMQAKFRQISEFLRLLEARLEAGPNDGEKVRVVDFGCGNAYLTFAVRDYLRNVRGRDATVTGVDSDAMAIERHRATCRELGWDDMHFEVSTIAGYRADPAPDIVMSLHACDTATDEVLAMAVRGGARLIFAVPCCHHHIQAQLDPRKATHIVQPVLRFGVMKERLGDILTDTLRAQILGIAGYRVDIVQFVSPEHTTKNLMIVAQKKTGAIDAGLAEQYRELRDAFHVRPYLETLLAETLAPLRGE